MNAAPHTHTHTHSHRIAVHLCPRGITLASPLLGWGAQAGERGMMLRRATDTMARRQTPSRAQPPTRAGGSDADAPAANAVEAVGSARRQFKAQPPVKSHPPEPASATTTTKSRVATLSGAAPPPSAKVAAAEAAAAAVDTTGWFTGAAGRLSSLKPYREQYSSDKWAANIHDLPSPASGPMVAHDSTAEAEAEAAFRADVLDREGQVGRTTHL